MNYTKLFYWLTVADNAKTFFVVLVSIFTAIAFVATIGYFTNTENSEKESQRMARKWMWWSYPLGIFFWSLYIFTPSKKDALLIVAGGQTMNFLTTDKSAKQIPHELTTFVVTELKNMASEAKVDLNIKSQKQKIIDSAKEMTTEELLSKIKTDTTFAKIILEDK